MNQASRFLLAAVCLVIPAAALPAVAQSSSSQQTPAVQAPANQPVNGAYVSTDPLAGVRYDNRWDVSVGLASGHIHAGPNIRDGANLGGLDVSGSYWLRKRLGVEASGRAYLGTSGTTPKAAGLGESGVFVAQYMFLAGPEYLGPHNKHAAIIFHALVGGAYDDFNKEIDKVDPSNPTGPIKGPYGPAGFYANQFAFGGAFGGHIDLNRSPRWVFRVTPDALMTAYDGTSQYSHTQWNFGISVGMQYKFKGKR
ncbi:MAG TPA: hypothetical protein VIM62_07995 [Acidobacteriaceae bacterium]